MKTLDINRLLNIGTALSKEKDSAKLFEITLTAAMDITRCDTGTLYIMGDNALEFHLISTRSRNIKKGGQYGKTDMPPVPLLPENVCAQSALTRQLINIPNIYDDKSFDFSGQRQYDELIGYKTVSMLVVPMENDLDEIIGVLQLINAQDDDIICEFDKDCERVISSLASQAAISLTNANYAHEMRSMFSSFVRVMSTAIDARTPYNANHTRNMVRYATAFFDYLEKNGSPLPISSDERDEFLMSIWLHDVGKLTIPLEIMDKDSRLGNKLVHVKKRFKLIALLNELSLARGENSKEEYDEVKRQLEKCSKIVDDANKSVFIDNKMIEELTKVSFLNYRDENGVVRPWIRESEIVALKVPRGTLTAAERKIMESHVVMTEKMLSEITFPTYYKNVPKWAISHHEFLDGSGYPRGLKAESLPMQVRLLTVLDLFEALTALDRPYKSAMTTKEAFEVLEEMVVDGKLDGELVAVFKQSRAWE